MTMVRDIDRSSKTMADNLRWLDENRGRVVTPKDDASHVDTNEHPRDQGDQQ